MSDNLLYKIELLLAISKINSTSREKVYLDIFVISLFKTSFISLLLTFSLPISFLTLFFFIWLASVFLYEFRYKLDLLLRFLLLCPCTLQRLSFTCIRNMIWRLFGQIFALLWLFSQYVSNEFVFRFIFWTCFIFDKWF